MQKEATSEESEQLKRDLLAYLFERLGRRRFAAFLVSYDLVKIVPDTILDELSLGDS